MPIYVDSGLEAIEDFPLDGEAVGWVPGRRSIILHEDALAASDAQLHALVAHEIAHHEGHHVLLGKLWKVIETAIGIALLLSMMVTAIFTQDFRLLAVLVPFYLVYPAFVMLTSAALSRRLELAADRRAADHLGSADPLVASLRSQPPRSAPSGLRERFWALCHPWPSPSTRLRALASEQ